MTETEAQEIPRATRPNPYNYTPLQFATRDKAINDMNKDFPNIPYKWLEWLYDTIENKDPEEVEKIINEGLWEKPVNTTRQLGGTLTEGNEVIIHQEITDNSTNEKLIQ